MIFSETDVALAQVLRSYFDSRDEPWMRTAECLGVGNGDFFLERGQSSSPGLRRCERCKVTGECDRYASESNSEWGIWGGKVRSREPVGRGQLTVVPTEPVRMATGDEVTVKSPTTGESSFNDQEVNLLPNTLSASAIETFLNCPAEYKAQIINRAQDLSGSAASLGTTCHTSIEGWLTDGHYLAGHPDEWAVMKAYYDEAYWANFADNKRYEEGAKLLKNWLARQDWSNRTVVSVEDKKSFPLPTSVGTIPVTYIRDRLDLRADGLPEVIDVKSLSMPLQPEDLKRKIQARIYAVATQLEYPDAERIWVTFDMLRYDSIGIVFTKAENRATWLYLRRIAEEIIASDGSRETINPTCRWCIRKSICETLHTHTVHGGTLGITDVAWAAQQLEDTRNIIGGLRSTEAELEKIVVDGMRAADQTEFTTGELDVAVAISGRRHIDPQMLATLVGDDIMVKYGSINVSNVDLMLRTEALTPEVKSRVKQLFTTNYSEPSIKIKKRSPF